MKNIHIVSTDKAPIKGDLLLRHLWKGNPRLECISWWRYNETTTLGDTVVYSTLNGSFVDTPSSFKTQHIYITSDEEIKEGDWFAVDLFKITGESGGLHIEKCIKLNDIWCNDFDVVSTRHKGNCKKIILTTDQDLIKDGVQAIDDDFLQWFVKNPNCESVEVKPLLSNNGRALFGYKIITPTEEPKQDCKHDIVTKYGVAECQNCGMEESEIVREEPKQEMRKVCKCKRAYENPLSEICSLCWNELYPNEKDKIKDEDLLEPKQETLEEAAENYSDIHGEKYEVKGQLHFVNTFNDVENAFKAGAKWQSDRMYSAEELKEWLVHRDLYLYNYYTTYIKSGIPLESVEDFIKEHHEYLMDRKLTKSE